MSRSADIVICGAGIAGTAAAYHLAAKHGAKRVLVVDERDPLTLTSDKGTQGYRNWWPGPDSTMLQLVSRSIDIMEDIARENNNAIRMSRRGYLFATARDEKVDELRRVAGEVSAFGMGEVREHPGSGAYVPAPPEGFENLPDGADLLLDEHALRAFPCLSPATRAVLHIRRAGWLNAIVLGTWSLNRAIAAGAEFARDRMTGVRVRNGRVAAVRLRGGGEIETENLVLAAGPLLHETGRMLGLDIPVIHEFHAKVTLRDPLGAIPRNAPFLIWTDGMRLDWSTAEAAALGVNQRDSILFGDMPGGVHVRPVDGPHGDELYLIWTYDNDPCAPVWPPEVSSTYAKAVLRAVTTMVPAMKPYANRSDAGFVDGGYYCKTRENRPLVGPLAVEGAWVCGALSGSGVMMAHGAADLLAAHMTGAVLPQYARWFLPARYDDPAYMDTMKSWSVLAGQL